MPATEMRHTAIARESEPDLGGLADAVGRIARRLTGAGAPETARVEISITPVVPGAMTYQLVAKAHWQAEISPEGEDDAT